MIKYETKKPKTITKIECTRESDYFVWIGKNRSAKTGDYKNYFDTWEEARDYLLFISEKKAESLKRQLDKTLQDIEDIEALRDSE